MWREYNRNPKAHRGDDCTIRAISTITGKSWEETYIDVCMQGFILKDMPSSNHVWGAYLKRKGFMRYVIPNTCPDCYTVSQFAEDHPIGKFILALHGHVVAVIDGDYYDTWDSGSQIPLYYWKKEE